MRNRVLALLAAVVLIVGAVALRGVLDDDDDGTEVATDTTSVTAPTGTVICIEELREQCTAIEGSTIEPAGTTIDRLAGGDDSSVVWVTLAPLPQAVDAGRAAARLDVLFTGGERIATTPLVLVARTDRGDVLKTTCGAVNWKCLGDNATRSWADLGGDSTWGAPKIGHDAPDTSARGAVLFAWAAADYFAGAQVNLDDEGFRTWLSQLERAVPGLALRSQSPLATMVTQLGSLDVVATTAADVEQIDLPNAFTLYPSDMARAEVVVATTGGALADGEIEGLRAALTSAGWDSAVGPMADAVPGLPDPGTVQALRTRIWDEV